MTTDSLYSAQKNWQIKHYRQRYAQSAAARKPLVLISGWSCDSDIFEWLIPGLAQHFVIVTAELVNIPDGQSFRQCCEELAGSLLSEFTQPLNFLAWSLGGNIAIELAHIHPDYCDQLIVLASSPVFVNQGDVDWAMPNSVFTAFQQQCEDNSVKGLRQFDRLMLSASDTSQLKSLRSALKDYRQQQDENNKAWSDSSLANGLKFLAQLDQRQILADLRLAKVCVHAILFADDALINCAAHNAYAHAEVIPKASHLGFLTHTDHVYSACLNLLQASMPASEDFDDKQAVAASFSQAAVKYDTASAVQQRIAQQLLDKLLLSITAKDCAPRYIIDAGCGTGLWTDKLSTFAEHTTGVDLAEGMLSYAKAKYPAVKHWLRADLEAMALLPEQADYIFSSLAIQWCTRLDTMLDHWFSLLQPGGEVFIATLATDTLHELAACFASIDKQAHVNDFYSFHDLLSFVEGSGFDLISAEQVSEVQYYPSAVALMHDLKDIGAHTVKTKAGLVKPTPMTKTQLSQLSNFYQRYRNEQQQLPATYDVVYLHLHKPLT